MPVSIKKLNYDFANTSRKRNYPTIRISKFYGRISKLVVQFYFYQLHLSQLRSPIRIFFPLRENDCQIHIFIGVFRENFKGGSRRIFVFQIWRDAKYLREPPKSFTKIPFSSISIRIGGPDGISGGNGNKLQFRFSVPAGDYTDIDCDFSIGAHRCLQLVITSKRTFL